MAPSKLPISEETSKRIQQSQSNAEYHYDINEVMNGIWVRALLGPMHLGLKTGPLCFIICY
jgi:hypothetical protein